MTGEEQTLVERKLGEIAARVVETRRAVAQGQTRRAELVVLGLMQEASDVLDTLERVGRRGEAGK